MDTAEVVGLDKAGYAPCTVVATCGAVPASGRDPSPEEFGSRKRFLKLCYV